GARPLTVTASGGKLTIVLDVNDVTPDQLLALVRPGASGRDLWLVARATGQVGLFPVISQDIAPTVSIDDLIAGQLTGIGVPALAFTNPVFVDVDGNGWRAPFAP